MQSASIAVTSRTPLKGIQWPLVFGEIVAIIFILTLSFGQGHPAGAGVYRIIGIGMVLVCLFLYLLYGLKVAPELWFFAAFILWSGITGFLVAENQEAVWKYERLLVQTWAMVLAIAGLCQARRSPALSFLAIVCIAVLLDMLMHTLGIYRLSLTFSPRRGSVHMPWNRNAVGMYNVYAMCGLLFFWKAAGWRLRRLVIPMVAVFIAISIVATGSRKSFLALLILGLMWLWFCYRREVLRSIRALLLVLVVLVGGYLLVMFALSSTWMAYRFELLQRLNTSRYDRIQMYIEGWHFFVQNPITGIGLGNYTYLSSFGRYSHSDYMETLSTTGGVGAFLYFTIYVILWLRLRRIARNTRDPHIQYAVGVIKALLVTALFLGLGVPNFLSVHYWFLIAGVIGYTYGLKNELRKAPARRLAGVVLQPVRA